MTIFRGFPGLFSPNPSPMSGTFLWYAVSCWMSIQIHFYRRNRGICLTLCRLMSYICGTALLTSRCCILNIYSTNVRTEYFIRWKNCALLITTCCIISDFLFSKCRLFHNATLFGSCIIHILNTECAKI
jgi:hypothetical protein